MQQPPRARTAGDTIQNPSGLIQINFLNSLFNQINKVIETGNREIDAMKQELALIENSRLHIDNGGRKPYFRCKSNQTALRTSISNDKDRIHFLARRRFLENRISAMELTNSKLLRITTSSGLSSLDDQLVRELKRFFGAGLDLSRIIFTREQQEWIDSLYTPNPHYLQNLKFKTRGGLPMRSKSEARLGSFIESVGLPYRSDDLVVINSGTLSLGVADHNIVPNRDSYFADIKLPNLIGGITLHEHLGAFNISEYGDNSLKKLNDYHNFTIIEIPGRPVMDKEITWSFESDLLNDETMSALVTRMLLPGLF